MENAQANGNQNPFISTTVDKQFAIDRARKAVEDTYMPDDYEILTIKGQEVIVLILRRRLKV